MKAGDRVKLVKSVGFYQVGAIGIITSMAGHNINIANVSIDRDADGSAISPPDPIPPQRIDYFQVIGYD